MDMPLARRSAPPLAKSRWSFLTAEWRNLCLFNYAVPPERLTAHLPSGLQLDTLDGQAFVSLIAFDFLHTRVLGIPWPGYRDFPEINLRFYVREGDRRGVAFIRELVPKRLIAWLARLLYNEPYQAVPMASTIERQPDMLRVEHRLHAGGDEQRISVTAKSEASLPAENSEAHFFKEHTWGYGCSRRGALLRYEVRHDVWEAHEVTDYELCFDFGAVYGPAWAWLSDTAPRSVLLAAGSPVRVSPLQ